MLDEDASYLLWYKRQKPKDIGQRAVPVTFVDAKIDGWMLDIANPPAELGVAPLAVTRAKNIWDRIGKLPYFRDILMNLPPGSAVQGELYVPGRPASDVGRQLHADVKQLQFAAHSIPAWDGGTAVADLHPYVVEAMLRKIGCKVVPRWHLDVTHLDDVDLSQPLRAFLVDESMAKGLLGLLRRDLDAEKYRPSKGYAVFRSPADVEGLVLKEKHFGGWWKYKTTKTIDVICTGLEEGTGANIGGVGALVGSVWKDQQVCPTCDADQTNLRGTCPVCRMPLATKRKLVVVANVSGMTQDIRDNVGDDDVGRVFEVEYQYLGAGEKLRHPRFLRWREDKRAEECTWSQVLEQRAE
jgi:hypothetical protein